MINIFNSNYEELGSLNKNLVLLTLGKVKIRYGKKFIDLLDNNGNINVQIPKVLKKVDSVDKINSDGLYLIDNELWAYVDGEKFLVEGDANKTFISYLSDLNLSLDQINTAQKNIGLKFDSLGDVNVDDSIVFVKDKIYYVNNGNFIELTVSLNEPLRSINSAGLGMGAENSILYFRNGRWTYTPLPTGSSEQITLNEPIEGLNNAGLGNPTNGQILAFKDNVWQYIAIPTSLQQGDTGVLLNFPLSDINSAGISNPLTASQPSDNAIVIAYDLNYWKPVYIPKIPTYIETIWWWSQEDMNNGGQIYYNLLFDSTIQSPELPTKKLPKLSKSFYKNDGTKCYDIPNSKYWINNPNSLNVCMELNKSDIRNLYFVWGIPKVKIYYVSGYSSSGIPTGYTSVLSLTRGSKITTELDNLEYHFDLDLKEYHAYEPWIEKNSGDEIANFAFINPYQITGENYGFVIYCLFKEIELTVTNINSNTRIKKNDTVLSDIDKIKFKITVTLKQQKFLIGGETLLGWDNIGDIGTFEVSLENYQMLDGASGGTSPVLLVDDISAHEYEIDFTPGRYRQKVDVKILYKIDNKTHYTMIFTVQDNNVGTL